MQANITLLPGDGIGPEVVAECEKVFNAVGQKFNHTFEFTTGLIGGIAIDDPGDFTLTIKPLQIAGDGLMDLRSVELRPTQATVAVSDEQWQRLVDTSHIEIQYT